MFWNAVATEESSDDWPETETGTHIVPVLEVMNRNVARGLDLQPLPERVDHHEAFLHERVQPMGRFAHRSLRPKLGELRRRLPTASTARVRTDE